MKRFFKALLKHPKFSLGSLISLLLLLGWRVGFFWVGETLQQSTVSPIDSKIESMSTREKVAQLFMVGLDSDHLNYKKSSHFQEELAEQGIGFVITNTYNYHQQGEYDEQYLRSIADFNAEVQYASLKSKSRLPVLIATDYEGPSYSSIRGGLRIPPSALCMGASQDVNLIKNTGKLVGRELSSIGLHLILGPVVDTYNAKQGNRSTLQDRCFSSSIQGSVCLASHYIEGLREGKIGSIIKHIPSYGSVEENPHDFNIPVFNGSKNSLNTELEWISKLSPTISGVMTSHITIKFLDNEKFAAFSKEFVTDILAKKVCQNRIIVSDDLTSMGAILKYKKEHNISYQQLAILAYEAGHDVLLFSHFKKHNPRSEFDIRVLNDSIDALTKYVESSKEQQNRLNHSVKKILELKINIAKLHGRTQEDVIGNSPQTITAYERRIKNYKLEAEKFLQDTGDAFPKTGDELIARLVASSSTNITEVGTPDISKLPKTSKVLFCVSEDYIPLFKNSFVDFPAASYMSIPRQKNSEEYSRLKQTFLKGLTKFDMVVYTATDISDADLLSFAYTNTVGLASKLIVFCLGNPIMFSDNLLKNVVLVSFFTNHPAAYPVTIDVLRGTVVPKKPTRIPVNLGDNQNFLQATTVWPECSQMLAEPSFLANEHDRTVEAVEFLSKTHFVFKKNWGYLVVLAIIVVLSLSVRSFMKNYYSQLVINENQNELLVSILRLYNHLSLLLGIILVYLLLFGLDTVLSALQRIAPIARLFKKW